MKAWLSRHRSALSTLTGGTLVAALVATAAIVSGGYSSQRLELGDGAVWVTSETRQAVARASTQALELNTVVEAGGSQMNVVQQGPLVAIVDEANAALTVIDPVTSTAAESVPLPPRSPQLLLAGDRAVVASDGELWNLAASDLASFDNASEPDLTLGRGTVVSMQPDGTFWAFSAAAGELYRIDAANGDTVAETVELDAGAVEDSYSVSSVGGHWAVLNNDSRTLYTENGSAGVSTQIPASGVLALQQPADSGERILLAHTAGLLAIPLAGGPATSLADAGAGVPSAPVAVGDCAFAAWADGSVWQQCGQERAAASVLSELPAASRLEFRVNGTAVVLSDARGGASWAVQQGNALMDNWDDLLKDTEQTQQIEQTDPNTPPVYEKDQVPPVAVDDEFGARPGRTAALPVLLNDYDANGDVLLISAITQPSIGRVDIVGNRQSLQIALPPEATGSVSFGYTINDGHGGSAEAVVTVTVRGSDENAAPVQVRPTNGVLENGGRLSLSVLGDWIDPDGDPFYLAQATVASPDTVSFLADGTVSYADAGGTVTEKTIEIQVSDGRLTGVGTVTLEIKPPGTVPLVAEPFAVPAYAGEEVTITPLTHVRGGSGPLVLSGVPAKPDAILTPDFDGGTFRFSSDTVGTHLVEYAVTDGSNTVTGIVRVEVAAPPSNDTQPVTVAHTVFLRAQTAGYVDVLAGDFDPAGGVLLITRTQAAPPGSGVRVEVIEQRILRITLTRPLEVGTVDLGYTVSNGRSEADGTVTVIEIPDPVVRQPPVASPDTVSARVGDAVDIRVLANDVHPDGDELSLHSELAVPLTTGGGLLFASGNILRYLAPPSAGNYTAQYRVDAPDGQFATAEVHIVVREADRESNTAPVPRALTARVLAGDTVRVAVPLGSIDPDGDSVTLLGQESNPEKGAVTEVGPDWIDYNAGEYSTGTDSFTYAVMDALGARATGTIRVGIAPRPDGARNPIAVADEVITRPGSTVSVRVMANDSDPDGGRLSLVSVEANGEGTAIVGDDVVTVTVPEAEGRYGFIYEIRNEVGGTSSAFLTIDAQSDAPLAVPQAHDIVLTLSDILDRDSIDVSVLAKVFFADGPTQDLGVKLVPGFEQNALVLANKRVRVTVAEHSQIIPFAVARTDDPTIVGHAFIRVPGTADTLPQLRLDTKPLSVPSEQKLSIDINDYVVAVKGLSVMLTDASTVRATHADGTDLVVDKGTLVFRSAQGYFGPASISFEVTDGRSPDDPSGRVSRIVLPITVTPRENQPPSFLGAVIELEPGQERVIDLIKLTSYPYPNDRGELKYTALEPLPVGVSYTIDGAVLTVRAGENTPRGSQLSLTLGVRDAVNPGRSGRIDMTIVPSTRPLASPAADSAAVQRGKTAEIDVLANDSATNPFPGKPLRVVAVTGLDSAALPAGVSITPSADKSRLAVSVSADAAVEDTTLRYQVADATNDPSRFTWGTVRVSVQDRPAPVTGLSAIGYGDRSVTVAFVGGAANNSPISGYQLSVIAADGSPISTQNCATTTCTVPTPGNGSASAVRVSVQAQNGVGLSDPVALVNTVWSDIVPPAPSSVTITPLNNSLRVSWPQVSAGAGSAVRSYVLSVGGSQWGEVPATGGDCTASGCSIVVDGLANGTDYALTVSARNDAIPALSSWNSASQTGRPYGPPIAGGLQPSGDPVNATVTLNWDPFTANGDPILGYFAQRLSNGQLPSGSQACSVTSPQPGELQAPVAGGNVVEQKSTTGTSATFTGLNENNADYSFVVWGYNKAGCVATNVQTVKIRPQPGQVQSVAGEMAFTGSNWDYKITSIDLDMPRYYLQGLNASGGTTSGWVQFPGYGSPREILNGATTPYGENVRFRVKACNVWASFELCGEPSGPKAAPEPSLTFEPSALNYNPATGEFGWGEGSPSNGEFEPTFSCSVPTNLAITQSALTPTSCTLSEPSPSGTVQLTVKINGHQRSFPR